MHIDFRSALRRDPWFVGGAGLALVLFFLASLGPFFSPHAPLDMSFHPLSPPTGEHWLGVNDGGMDILAELLYALRNTMWFGLATGLIALFFGVGIGLTTAWCGGWIDLLCMRLADMLMAVPAVMILIMTAALFRPAAPILVLVLAGLIWPTTAKAVRSQAIAIKGKAHIRAARQMGASGRYIMARHLLPELFPLYLIGFVAKARMAVFMEVSLAFLGLFDPSRKSLGMMIGYALKYYFLDIWWNWLLPPVVLLCLLIMAVTFLAVSLEKVFDPRLNTRVPSSL